METLQVAEWPWYYVGIYFFLGGIAAGAYLISTIADLFGDSEEDAPLIKMGYYLATILLIICALLLILDLGQPGRFWRMLTQFKLLSPVSLGSWGLTLFGLFAGLLTAIWLAEDGYLEKGRLKSFSSLASPLRSLPRKVLAVIGGFFGIFVAGYTGVLLSSTTNPFWAGNQLLGISFLVSALSTAIALVSILLIWRGHSKLIVLHNFRDLWLVVLGFEVFLILWELFHEAGAVLVTGQFLFTFVILVAIVGVLIPLILLAIKFDKPMSNSMIMVIAILVLIGGFFFRYSVLVAGQQFIGEAAEHASLLMGLFV